MQQQQVLGDVRQWDSGYPDCDSEWQFYFHGMVRRWVYRYRNVFDNHKFVYGRNHSYSYLQPIGK